MRGPVHQVLCICSGTVAVALGQGRCLASHPLRPLGVPVSARGASLDAKKTRIGRVSPQEKEGPMTALITIYELEQLTGDRLVDLFDTLSRLLPLTDAVSADRRNILASLENIETVQRQRRRKHAPSI